MRIEKIVGLNMREGRVALGMTQAELGRRLGDYLGKSWSRQATSLAEAGQRAFTAAEIVSLAHILQLRGPGSLLMPPPGVKIDVTDDFRIERWTSSPLGLATPEDQPLYDEMREAIALEVRRELVERLKEQLNREVQHEDVLTARQRTERGSDGR